METINFSNKSLNYSNMEKLFNEINKIENIEAINITISHSIKKDNIHKKEDEIFNSIPDFLNKLKDLNKIDSIEVKLHTYNSIITLEYNEYTKEELFDHYGIEFDVTDIFPDMVEENTDSYGIYMFSDGRDMQGHNFVWTNAGNGEEIDIEIIKDGTPKTDVNLADGGTPAQSTISGKSVTVFHFDTDGQTGYYAEFEYKDLGFSVYGYNLGEEDFISLLSYLLSR